MTYRVLNPKPDWPPCCNKCGKQLSEPGALCFGPPDDANLAYKLHFCRGCWLRFLEWIESPPLAAFASATSAEQFMAIAKEQLRPAKFVALQRLAFERANKS